MKLPTVGDPTDPFSPKEYFFKDPGTSVTFPPQKLSLTDCRSNEVVPGTF